MWSVCEQCGAVVAEADRHEGWHALTGIELELPAPAAQTVPEPGDEDNPAEEETETTDGR
jgi:hypothetical protein